MMMKLSFLSEMSAEPIHGGGVTLKRILRDDLNKFQSFIKVVHYRNEPRINSKKYQVFPFGHQAPKFQKIIGCTLTAKLFQSNLLRNRHSCKTVKFLLQNQIITNQSKLLVCPQGAFTLYTMNELSKHMQVPYITWMMDDHLLNWNDHRGFFYKCDHYSLMEQHLKNALKVFVISPQLKDFYQKYFGVECEVLFSPVPAVNHCRDKQSQKNKNPKLVYFGSITPWQEDALEVLIPLAQQKLITLDIFSSHKFVRDTSLNQHVNFHQPISSEHVIDIMRSYDAVIIPISFKKELYNMSYFNIATKMSECIGSGVPTLLVGPSDSAMIKFLNPYNACVTITSASQQHVIDAIDTLKDTSKRKQMLENAHTLVQEELSENYMARKWKFAFDALCSL